MELSFPSERRVRSGLEPSWPWLGAGNCRDSARGGQFVVETVLNVRVGSSKEESRFYAGTAGSDVVHHSCRSLPRCRALLSVTPSLDQLRHLPVVGTFNLTLDYYILESVGARGGLSFGYVFGRNILYRRQVTYCAHFGFQWFFGRWVLFFH